jgi:hypothetical protein
VSLLFLIRFTCRHPISHTSCLILFGRDRLFFLDLLSIYLFVFFFFFFFSSAMSLFPMATVKLTFKHHSRQCSAENHPCDKYLDTEIHCRIWMKVFYVKLEDCFQEPGDFEASSKQIMLSSIKPKGKIAPSVFSLFDNSLYI